LHGHGLFGPGGGRGRRYDGASALIQTSFPPPLMFKLSCVVPAGHGLTRCAFIHTSPVSPISISYPAGHVASESRPPALHSVDPGDVGALPAGHTGGLVFPSSPQKYLSLPLMFVAGRYFVPAGHTSVYQLLIVLTQHLRRQHSSDSRAAGLQRRCAASPRGCLLGVLQSTWPSCPANQSTVAAPRAWSRCIP
jgi:hypothetical protein